MVVEIPMPLPFYLYLPLFSNIENFLYASPLSTKLGDYLENMNYRSFYDTQGV
jgi:hypothetical protein